MVLAVEFLLLGDLIELEVRFLLPFADERELDDLVPLTPESLTCLAERLPLDAVGFLVINLLLLLAWVVDFLTDVVLPLCCCG